MSQPTIHTTVTRSGAQYQTETPTHVYVTTVTKTVVTTTETRTMGYVKMAPINYRDPGWSTCPYCGEGHDPSEACFD
ncbi:hypothetical protein RBB50_012436 [Rhinocladiella similis]